MGKRRPETARLLPEVRKTEAGQAMQFMRGDYAVVCNSPSLRQLPGRQSSRVTAEVEEQVRSQPQAANKKPRRSLHADP
jgi:hypothetical protein